MSISQIPSWFLGLATLFCGVLCAIIWNADQSWRTKSDGRMTALEQRADLGDAFKTMELRLNKLADRVDVSEQVKTMGQNLDVLRVQVEANMRAIAGIGAKQEERSAKFLEINGRLDRADTRAATLEAAIADLRARMPK